MRKFTKFLSLLMALTILLSLAVPSVFAAETIKIPLTIELPYAVAGVEIDFSYTSGLTFVKWEKSAAIKSAGTTPIVDPDKDGIWKAGIFTASNVYAPDENGVLDLGYLVFSAANGTAGQSATVHVAEYVHVVNKTTTENGTYETAVTVNLPLQPGAAFNMGGELAEGGDGSSDSVTKLPSVETIVAGPIGDCTVAIEGKAAVEADEDVVFTITADDVTDLATATLYVELDSELVEEPVAEGCGNFVVFNQSFVEENGKWCGVIAAFYYDPDYAYQEDGLTTTNPVDIVTISAAAKGEVGTVAAELTGSVLSGYYVNAEGENDEGMLNSLYADTTASTEIEEVTEDDSLLDILLPVIGGAAGGAGGVEGFPFVDVPEGSWYYDSVASAWAHDLIDGVTATHFMPEKTLTVAEAIKLAAVLYQMDNEGAVTLGNGSDKWYSTYVDYAITNGIIEEAYKNYTDAQMNAAVTRAEFVHIFHGAMDNYYVIGCVGDNRIPDVKLGDYAADEIYEFYRAGICIGNDKYGTFLPQNSIKRSEVATILNRMYDLDAREIVHLP